MSKSPMHPLQRVLGAQPPLFQRLPCLSFVNRSWAESPLTGLVLNGGHSRASYYNPSPPTSVLDPTVVYFLLGSGIFPYCAAGGRGFLSGKDMIVEFWSQKEVHSHRATFSQLALCSGMKLSYNARPRGPLLRALRAPDRGGFTTFQLVVTIALSRTYGSIAMKHEVISPKEQWHHSHSPLCRGRR